MRIFEGTTVVAAPPPWRAAVAARDRRVVIDLGAGDGRFAYECARTDPTSLYIGVDPNADALAEYAYRSSRKPARGGIENVLYVVAAVETPPPELAGLADLVCVNFPWGSLLRGLLLPETAILASLAQLARPGGAIELVLTYDASHDRGIMPAAFDSDLTPVYVDATLTPAYAATGIAIEERRRLTQEEALAIPSTWGRRLLHGRPRHVYLVRGHVR